MLLALSQEKLLRLASYRRDPYGIALMRLAPGERRTAQALVNFGLAITTGGRLFSTRKGEVQIELENERIARSVRRARRRR